MICLQDVAFCNMAPTQLSRTLMAINTVFKHSRAGTVRKQCIRPRCRQPRRVTSLFSSDKSWTARPPFTSLLHSLLPPPSPPQLPPNMGNFAANEGLSLFVIVSVFCLYLNRLSLTSLISPLMFFYLKLQSSRFSVSFSPDESLKTAAQMCLWFKNERFQAGRSRFSVSMTWKLCFSDFQLVWLGINGFLFVHFYRVFLEDRWFYTRVLLGVSPHFHSSEPPVAYFGVFHWLKMRWSPNLIHTGCGCFHFLLRADSHLSRCTTAHQKLQFCFYYCDVNKCHSAQMWRVIVSQAGAF